MPCLTGGTNISFQSVTKGDADTRRDSHANIVLSGVAKDDLTLSMVLPFTRQGDTSGCEENFHNKKKFPQRIHGETSQQPSLQALFSEASQAKQRRSRFFLCGRVFSFVVQNVTVESFHGGALTFSTRSRTLASGVLRRTIHSSSLLHCVLWRFRFNATLQSVTKCDADFSTHQSMLYKFISRGCRPWTRTVRARRSRPVATCQSPKRCTFSTWCTCRSIFERA